MYECKYIPFRSLLIHANTHLVQISHTNESSSSLSPSLDAPPVCRYVPHNSSFVPLNNIHTPTDPFSSSHKRTKSASVSGNIHHMQTHSKSPLHALIVFHISSNDLTQMEPSSIHDAILSPHWTTVVQEELSTLSSNKAWYVVSLPPGRILISCK